MYTLPGLSIFLNQGLKFFMYLCLPVCTCFESLEFAVLEPKSLKICFHVFMYMHLEILFQVLTQPVLLKDESFQKLIEIFLHFHIFLLSYLTFMCLVCITGVNLVLVLQFLSFWFLCKFCQVEISRCLPPLTVCEQLMFGQSNTNLYRQKKSIK